MLPRYKNGEAVRDKILEFLKLKQKVISPVSMQEIGDEVDISSKSVVGFHLDVLEKQGKIIRHGTRQIEVVE